MPHAWPLLQQTNLPQDGSLIPVNTLGGHLAVAKIDNNHHLNGDPLAGGRYAGQKPVHLLRVVEADRGFFDNAVVSRHTVGKRVLPLWRNRGNELIAI